jgi:coenzyme F420-reducing hydrogenase delta subunit
MLKRLLAYMGIDDRRFYYTWVSASEGARWQQVVTDFTRQVHELGPLHPEKEESD